MTYEVLRTDTADEQLTEIIRYIAMDSGSADVALSYLDKLETAIMSLAEFPERGSFPRYAVLRRRGFRVLVVGNHLVFYKVYSDIKKVIVYAIVDGRRDYKGLVV